MNFAEVQGVGVVKKVHDRSPQAVAYEKRAVEWASRALTPFCLVGTYNEGDRVRQGLSLTHSVTIGRSFGVHNAKVGRVPGDAHKEALRGQSLLRREQKLTSIAAKLSASRARRKTHAML